METDHHRRAAESEDTLGLRGEKDTVCVYEGATQRCLYQYVVECVCTKQNHGPLNPHLDTPTTSHPWSILYHPSLSSYLSPSCFSSHSLTSLSPRRSSFWKLCLFITASFTSFFHYLLISQQMLYCMPHFLFFSELTFFYFFFFTFFPEPVSSSHTSSITSQPVHFSALLQSSLSQRFPLISIHHHLRMHPPVFPLFIFHSCAPLNSPITQHPVLSRKPGRGR